MLSSYLLNISKQKTFLTAFCKFSKHYELEMKAICEDCLWDLHQVLEQTSTFLLALELRVENFEISLNAA